MCFTGLIFGDIYAMSMSMDIKAPQEPKILNGFDMMMMNAKF